MGIRGIGGIFFKASNPETLADWYERHLGVRRDDEGYTVLGWREYDRPERIGETVWSPFPADTEYFAPSDASWMVARMASRSASPRYCSISVARAL